MRILFVFVFLSSVSFGQSKKGAWTNSDKEAVRNEIKDDIKSKDVLDCIISALEKEYESFNDANSDESAENTEKLTNLMMDCMENYGYDLYEQVTEKQVQSTLTQLQIVYASGGEGRNKNFKQEYQEYISEFGSDGDGPGFISGDCSQGINPKRASSVLSPQGKKGYNINNLNDDNPMTAWVEGDSLSGIGEWFEIKGLVNKIYNGYQSSATNWKNNSRVKKFLVYENGTPICYLKLTDEMGAQHFDLPTKYEYDGEYESSAPILRFEIVEVYEGLKWADVCISELDYVSCCFASDTYINDPNENIKINTVKEKDEIKCIDIDKNTTYKSKVENIVSVDHVNLIKISTPTKSLTLTKDHPLNFKGHGFISLKRLSKRLNTEIDDLSKENIFILTWDRKSKSLKYEKLNSIQSLEGKQKTYSIRKISNGTDYIVNGFVTRTY